MRSDWSWYDAFWIFVFIYLLILQVQAIWPFTVDDMYISLRYARNWVSGVGLLWNVGAPPVEGYSNFSFVVLATVALALKINPILVLKYAGFCGLLLTTYFVYLISRFWCSTRLALLPCIVLLLYKGQIIWSVSGLETTVYQALVCGSVFFIYRGLGYCLYPLPRQGTRSFFLMLAGFFLALAGLTRPETPALMVLFFLLICWDSLTYEKSEFWVGVFAFLLPLIFIFSPYFIWRWHYYGYLFPNSFYCKGFSSSLAYLLDFNYFKLIWPFALLSLPAIWMAEDKRHYFLWLPSVVYLLLLREADPVVAFYNRLFLAAFALMIPLAFHGLLLIGDYLGSKLLFLVSFVVLCLIGLPKMSLAQYHYFSENPLKGEVLRKQVITWMNAHLKPEDKVVLADAGMIPYYSQQYIIDSYCLNNVTMAHYSEQQRYEQFCQHVLDEHPQAIILTSLQSQGGLLYTPADDCLKKILNHQNKYQLSKKFISQSPASIYQYELFTPSKF